MPPDDGEQGTGGSGAGDSPTGGSWFLGIGHFLLDVIGFIPVVGEWADGLNAAWYASEGRYFEASLSAAATVPFAGIGATLGKWFGRTVTIARAEDLAAGAQFGEQTIASLERLRTHGFGDIADAAVDSLASIGRTNVETSARISDILNDPTIALSPNLRSKLEKASRNLREHLQDKDLSGALQETLGIAIGGFDHVQEVTNGVEGLEAARDALNRALNHAQFNGLSTQEISRLQNTKEAIEGMIVGTQSVLEVTP